MSTALSRRWVAAFVALVVLAGISAFGYWWTHPTLFNGAGTTSGYTRPVHIGSDGITVGVLLPAGSGGTTVRVRGASAHFTPHSAHADATFRVCTGEPIGLVLDPAASCANLAGLPANLDLQAGSHQSLIMTVTPTSAGQVTIESVTIDYRQGGADLWQQGNQTIPLSLTFPAGR